jgi:hypothetical protein
VPAVAISTAAIAAVSWVPLTNVVVLAAPLNFTTDVDTKPVPFTVNVNPAPPAVALVGEMDVSVGAELLIVNVCAFDVPPPAGFVIVTFTVPAVTISAAGIVATICVLVTDDGVIAGLVPKLTVAPVTKPVPVIVSVNAAPLTVAVAGAIEVSVGPEIVNDRVEPLIEPDAAEIVVEPVPTPVASPPLVIVATAVFAELQVTELVRFCVLLSL